MLRGVRAGEPECAERDGASWVAVAGLRYRAGPRSLGVCAILAVVDLGFLWAGLFPVGALSCLVIGVTLGLVPVEPTPDDLSTVIPWRCALVGSICLNRFPG